MGWQFLVVSYIFKSRLRIKLSSFGVLLFVDIMKNLFLPSSKIMSTKKSANSVSANLSEISIIVHISDKRFFSEDKRNLLFVK